MNKSNIFKTPIKKQQAMTDRSNSKPFSKLKQTLFKA